MPFLMKNYLYINCQKNLILIRPALHSLGQSRHTHPCLQMAKQFQHLKRHLDQIHDWALTIGPMAIVLKQQLDCTDTVEIPHPELLQSLWRSYTVGNAFLHLYIIFYKKKSLCEEAAIMSLLLLENIISIYLNIIHILLLTYRSPNC